MPVPKTGTLGLWRNPVRRERASIVNAGAEAGQIGREVFDAGSVIVYDANGIAMTLGPRPPSKREQVESASVEYPLALPVAKPLRLEFSTSETFAGGAATTLYDAAASGAVSVGLELLGEQSVLLRFEAHGGDGRRRPLLPGRRGVRRNAQLEPRRRNCSAARQGARSPHGIRPTRFSTEPTKRPQVRGWLETMRIAEAAVAWRQDLQWKGRARVRGEIQRHIVRI